MKPVETLDLNTLGGQITYRRQMAGLTLRALSEKSGVNFVVINEIELGKAKRPNVYAVQRLALALGVGIETLIGVPKATDEVAS